jgi:hypothetical protein
VCVCVCVTEPSRVVSKRVIALIIRSYLFLASRVLKLVVNEALSY